MASNPGGSPRPSSAIRTPLPGSGGPTVPIFIFSGVVTVSGAVVLEIPAATGTVVYDPEFLVTGGEWAF